MSSSDDKPVTKRLFFALWPDEVLRKEIRKHLKKVLQHGGGKRVAEHNLHITLSFLGMVDETQQHCAEQFVDSIAFEPVTLAINKVDYWSKPRVLWAGCSDVPASLIEFVYKLNEGMRECGINVDTRPFVPHITLMRKVNKAPQHVDFKAFQWHSDSIALVESKTHAEGVQYHVIKSV